MTKQRHPTYTNRVDMLMHLCVYIACKYTHIHATHIYCAWACRMHVCVHVCGCGEGKKVYPKPEYCVTGHDVDYLSKFSNNAFKK